MIKLAVDMWAGDLKACAKTFGVALWNVTKVLLFFMVIRALFVGLRILGG